MRKKRRSKEIAVGFITLGCPKNTVDSERMLAEIVQAGFIIAEEPGEADVIVVNTCGFIRPAKEEAIETLREAIGYKKRGRVKKVIAAGCLCERMGAPLLFKEVEGLDAIAGLGQRDNIVQIIRDAIGSQEQRAYMEHVCADVADDRTRLLVTARHWAYLRISEGCDHSCSFCTIPAIRGRFKSKTEEMILTEAEELASAGVVELNVIAQDTSYYGKDLQVKDGLSKLVGRLEKVAGIKWIRLMYMYPVGITERLIETVRGSEKIVHYFDIPIQHINNRILKDMRRPDTKEQICGLIERLRKAIPDIVLRTTVIVGFPGETDEEFGELVEFIRWAKFDALGCFGYYAEEGTKAAEMAGQVAEEVKRQRVDELMTAQQEVAFSLNEKRVGTEIACLVDKMEKKGRGVGRFYGQAPEIDSLCVISRCSGRIGEFIKAKVVGTSGYDLLVEQI